MNRAHKVRDYTKQFEGEVCRRITALIDGYGAALTTSEYKYQVHELQGCLRVGLLLSALHNAASLLELFVRDLVARHELRSAGKMVNWELGVIRRELELEGDRNMTFIKLIQRANEFGLVNEQDKGDIVRFYNETRIPLAHGIIRRFVAKKNGFRDELLQELFDPLARFHGFEGAIESSAIADLGVVLEFIRKHRHHLFSMPDDERQRV